MGEAEILEKLRKLADGGQWLEILDETNPWTGQQDCPAPVLFFRGWAFHRADKVTEALAEIERGLSITPRSGWGNRLLFDALVAFGRHDAAYSRYGKFLIENKDTEDAKAYFVEVAAELGCLGVAGWMNLERDVNSKPIKPSKFAVCIQAFAKQDTLEKLFQSILSARSIGEFSVVVIQDGIDPSKHSAAHIAGARKTAECIGTWVPKLADLFVSVEYIRNKGNLGTAATCRRLLDYACRRHDGFLFLEDDCIIAPDAIEWAKFHLENTIDPLGPWFLGCESTMFNAENREYTGELRDRLARIARHPMVRDKHMFVDFVPSTCFGTTSAIWGLCSNVRSFTRGPESLTRFMRSMDRKTVVPIVPRASDIGMLHPLGYSIATVGKDYITEIKNTVVISSAHPEDPSYGQFCGDVDQLYNATSLLNEAAVSAIEASFLTSR